MATALCANPHKLREFAPASWCCMHVNGEMIYGRSMLLALILSSKIKKVYTQTQANIDH